MTTRELAVRMADAAQEFLGSLDADQRALAQWSFTQTTERETWFFTPTDHGGLPLGAMTPHQQKLAHKLLALGLSESGYNVSVLVMGWENVLDRLEGHVRDWGRERGRDPGLYYWRVFGDPGLGEPWSWRVGGHHVSVQHVIVDGDVVGSTPLFIGADPARAPLAGDTLLEPLGPLEAPARDFVLSLGDADRARAVVTPHPPTDLVSANRAAYGDGDLPIPLPELWRGRLQEPWDTLAHEVQAANDEAAGVTEESLEAIRLTRAPRGLPLAGVGDEQEAFVRALLDAYAGRLPGPLAELERAKYAGSLLGQHSFLWAGSLAPHERFYYRVQGPRLLVECDNTQRAGNHIHTVWRDPYRDFGRDPLDDHLRTGHARI